MRLYVGNGQSSFNHYFNTYIMKHYHKIDLGKSFEIFTHQLKTAKEMANKDEPDAYAHAFGYLSGCANGFINHYEHKHKNSNDIPENLFHQ